MSDTSDDALWTLIAQWRIQAANQGAIYASGLLACADDLESLLARDKAWSYVPRLLRAVAVSDYRSIGPRRVLHAEGTDVPQLQTVARVTERGPIETQANAHLIAAAPDLLAESIAAETMLSQLLAALNKAKELGATRVDVGDLRVAVEHRLKPLRAAIAKAEVRR
jgi:hypothetical protein